MISTLSKTFEIENINSFDFLNNPIQNKIYIYRFNENIGYSKANNFAFRKLYDYNFQNVLLSNPDVLLLENNNLEKLFYDLNSSKKVLAVFPNVIGPDGKLTGNNQGPFFRITFFTILMNEVKIIRKLYNYKKKKNKSKINKIYTSLGCFMLLDLYNLNYIDYFDEDFFLYKEEQVLGEKAIKNKLDILFTPESFVYHDHDYSSKPVNILIQNKSDILFYKKYQRFNKFKLFLLKIILLKNKKDIKFYFPEEL